MVILLGAPGSGKGTQARLLAQNDGYKIFALGEILRAEIAHETENGKKIGASLARGEFADLDIVVSLLKQHVYNSHYVLDGFPRNTEQVVEFEKFVNAHAELTFEQITVVDFIVPLDVLKTRLQQRRICKICDAALMCDARECKFCGHVGEDAYVRDDDSNAQAVARRLKIFERERDGLVKCYMQKGIYHAIDATLPVEEVHAKLKQAIAGTL